MKRRIPTSCLAFTLGTLALLARGQNPTPLFPPPTVEQAAGHQSNLPELTLEQAVEQAVANNSSLKTASLDTLRAADDLAANKTRRFANTQITALGAQLVTKPSVTYPAGALGVRGVPPARCLITFCAIHAYSHRRVSANCWVLGLSSLSERSRETRRKSTADDKVSDPATDTNRQKTGKER
jgi:hypothetical protein